MSSGALRDGDVRRRAVTQKRLAAARVDLQAAADDRLPVGGPGERPVDPATDPDGSGLATQAYGSVPVRVAAHRCGATQAPGAGRPSSSSRRTRRPMRPRVTSVETDRRSYARRTSPDHRRALARGRQRARSSRALETGRVREPLVRSPALSGVRRVHRQMTSSAPVRASATSNPARTLSGPRTTSVERST